MRSGLTRRWWLLGAVLGLGCYSPTLPLPPPLKPDITMTETGEYHLSGGVLPDAQISALNETNLLIDGQQADHLGFYSFDLHGAVAHDVIEIWYRYANDLSSVTPFELPDLSAQGGAGGKPAGGAGSDVGGAQSGEGRAAGTSP